MCREAFFARIFSRKQITEKRKDEASYCTGLVSGDYLVSVTNHLSVFGRFLGWGARE